jgi:NAD(P)-dependent dehydrogenase (short-subunit alcohol dehydrogenase family)
MRLDRKRSFITGAADGIGAATARLFAQEGASVTLVDIEEARGSDLARELSSQGHRVQFIRVDVSKSDEIASAVDQAEQWSGGLDIIHAGIEAGAGHMLADIPEDDFDRLLSVNLKGVFLGMKHGIPALERAGGGAIVNTASLAGIAGVPGFAAYSATKGGVVLLTKTAALEYGPSNIRVNCVCPGFVATSMTERLSAVQFDDRLPPAAPAPISRGASPEEIAEAVLYLASDQASFVTGVALPVDGGVAAR